MRARTDAASSIHTLKRRCSGQMPCKSTEACSAGAVLQHHSLEQCRATQVVWQSSACQRYDPCSDRGSPPEWGEGGRRWNWVCCARDKFLCGLAKFKIWLHTIGQAPLTICLVATGDSRQMTGRLWRRVGMALTTPMLKTQQPLGHHQPPQSAPPLLVHSAAANWSSADIAATSQGDGYSN